MNKSLLPDNEEESPHFSNSLLTFEQVLQPNLNTSIKNYDILNLNFREKEILKELTQIDFNFEIAVFIIKFISPGHIDQVFEFITCDETGYYHHPFIINSEEDADFQICQLCNGKADKHNESTEEDLMQIKSIQVLIQDYMNGNTHPEDSPRSLRDSFIQSIITQECQICLQQINEDNFLYMNGICHKICLDCFREYLTSEILEGQFEVVIQCNYQKGKVYKMKCPHCNEILTLEQIQKNTLTQTFQKYKDFLNNDQVARDPMVRWCANPKCSKILKLNSKSDKIVSCDSCGTKVCCLCNHVAHPKITCEKNLEKELQSWIHSKDIQRCPKCKALVEKFEGCNHMTCRMCDYEFCWLCRGTYTSYHFSPFNPFGCPGLMDDQYKQQNWGRCKRIGYRILIFVLWILAVPLIIVFLSVCSGIVLIVIITEDGQILRSDEYNSKIVYILAWIAAILIGIIITPLIDAIVAIASLPVAIAFIVFYIRERLKLRRRYKIKLKEKNIK